MLDSESELDNASKKDAVGSRDCGFLKNGVSLVDG